MKPVSVNKREFMLRGKVFRATVTFSGGDNYDSIKLDEIIKFKGNTIKTIATFKTDREYVLWLKCNK